MVIYFRKLVGAVIGLYLFYLFNPILFQREYSAELKEAYSWFGYGAILDPFGPITFLLAIGNIASLIGVFFFSKNARNALLGLYGLYVFLIPMWGIAVIGSFDALLSALVNTGVVAIIVLSFTTVEEYFK